jgi:hypothetical protein
MTKLPVRRRSLWGRSPSTRRQGSPRDQKQGAGRFGGEQIAVRAGAAHRAVDQHDQGNGGEPVELVVGVAEAGRRHSGGQLTGKRAG